MSVSPIIRLTDEQDEIINTTPYEDGALVISAFAGTGKTFTLQKYAEDRPKETILYAAYNKAIQLDAESKMPINVSCRTTHSLAYRAIGAKYREIDMLRASVPLWRISKLLKTNVVLSYFVMQTVNKFVASADRTLDESHILDEALNYYNTGDDDDTRMPPIVDMATEVWENMISTTPGTLPITHDTYLKLYQLSSPILNFDYILLDEAQDTTPCVWDIVNKQHAKKIITGDEHQTIYSWRGTINAMRFMQDSDHLYLSQSFRFGPEVAKLANTLLHRFKNEQVDLTGNPNVITQVYTNGNPDKYVTLARGNYHIYRAAASEVLTGTNTLGFVGGDMTNYRFPFVLDAFYLMDDQHDKIKDPLIKSFTDFEELKNYADKTRNPEIKSACVLAEEFKRRVPFIHQKVKQQDCGTRFAHLVFSTAHKSKGLEFPVVKLASDFTNLITSHIDHPLDGIMTVEEINLLYVAITRATRDLFISPTIKSFIETGSLMPIPLDIINLAEKIEA